MFDLASTIAPAALIRATRNASSGGDEALERRASRRWSAGRSSRSCPSRSSGRSAAGRPGRRLRPPVERVGLGQRVGIDDDDGVDRRPVLVVGVDAAEIVLDQPMAGERPSRNAAWICGDGGFFDRKGRGGLGGQRPGAKEQGKGWNGESRHVARSFPAARSANAARARPLRFGNRRPARYVVGASEVAAELSRGRRMARRRSWWRVAGLILVVLAGIGLALRSGMVVDRATAIVRAAARGDRGGGAEVSGLSAGRRVHVPGRAPAPAGRGGGVAQRNPLSPGDRFRADLGRRDAGRRGLRTRSAAGPAARPPSGCSAPTGSDG